MTSVVCKFMSILMTAIGCLTENRNKDQNLKLLIYFIISLISVMLFVSFQLTSLIPNYLAIYIQFFINRLTIIYMSTKSTSYLQNYLYFLLIVPIYLIYYHSRYLSIYPDLSESRYPSGILFLLFPRAKEFINEFA